MEVKDTLTILGISTAATSVAWRPNAAADKVFELFGDYTLNGVVDSGDYTIWRKQDGMTGTGLFADGIEDGTVDALDYTIYQQHFGNTLTVNDVNYAP